MGILIIAFILYLSTIVIARASNGFEAAADYLGRNLQDGVKGATINAIGSSMPELFTTFIFLVVLNDSEGFASGIGTTAGSAVFNGMIIPALVIFTVFGAGVTRWIEVSKKVILRDGLALIFCEIVLIMFLSGTQLTSLHGALLISLYAVYVIIMLKTMSKDKKVVQEVEHFSTPSKETTNKELPKNTILNRIENHSITNFMVLSWLDLEGWVLGDKKIKQSSAWVLLISSTVVMGLGCHWLVEACIMLGHDEFTLFGLSFEGLGIPIYFLSVIIASAATSLPDTLLSMKDAKKGNYNDAVSNALGSNIFDICFALGLPLLLFTLVNGPIVLPKSIILEISELRVLLVILTILSFFVFYIGKKFTVTKGVILASFYLVFSGYIFGRALKWEFLEPIAIWLHEISAAMAVNF